MDQFYLTLPSDSSSKYYPENTIASFRTKLSDRIELDGEYEVGLAQLIYPYSWFNFYNKDGSMYVNVYNGVSEPQKIVFTSGQFHDEATLMKHLNDKIKISGFVFLWNPFSRKIKLGIAENCSLFMSEAFKTQFGFKDEGSYLAGTHYSTPGFDLKESLRLMFIYCDVASYTFVGDTKVPLLRVCDTEGEYFGQTVRMTFTHPHYIPVGRTSFECLEVNINNELGQHMPFEFGKSVVTLHFRRKNKLLL